MKTLKIVKIDDPEALDYIGRCEIYQAISDYEIWRRMPPFNDRLWIFKACARDGH